jgi:type VI secretion system secreted protein VgrG
MAYTQANRQIAISTPLGADTLLLRSFNGTEAISQLFHFDLDLLSENPSISFQSVVGKNVTLRILDLEGKERYWNGFISRFSQGPKDQRLTAYRAEMVPWLWFLTRTADCRIFQKKKVPDIIQKIFADLGFQDFALRLYGDFVEREYCVQYRETDFNFISRLMEEEGIYYFFEHQKDKHIMVLANDPAACKDCPTQKTVRYDTHGDAVRYEDVLTEWFYQEEFRTGAWAQTDYNFETPSTSLAVSVNGKNKYEIYEFPGEYLVRPDGDKLAKIRLQEQTVPCNVSHASGGCRHFGPGYTFTLQDHYRTDLNQKYLITTVRQFATEGGAYEATADDQETYKYHNSFDCIPYSTPFRPARVTPQPFVQGCQTAVVVGPSGEEIYTDKHGRVKVQFHWDREGKKNENSSCWVRVSHPWAGQGWGAISIPRIGQEVVVDFLEGNPDQPIIIGRVYNAEQMPPFGMPSGAVVSGVKSNSTKGGGGYNEISLNDTKGTELINIHAQYDQQKKVEHDERVDIGNDRTEHVKHDEKITIDNCRTEKVGVDEKITIGNNRTEEVGNNENITIKANRTEHVVANETINVDGNRTRNVKGSETVTVTQAQTITVLAAQTVSVALARTRLVGAVETVHVVGNQGVTVDSGQSITVTGGRNVTVTGDQTTSITGNRNEMVTADHTEKINGKRETQVGNDDTKKVGNTWAVEAGDQIAFKCGKSSLLLKSDGTIQIEGKDITVDCSGDADIQAKGEIEMTAKKDMTLNGKTILQNC